MIALLLHLPHGGAASFAPLGSGPVHTVAQQQIDHVRRQAQIVVQPCQYLQVCGAQLFAQLLLRLGDQQAEALVVRQQGGDVLCGVNGLFRRRFGAGRLGPRQESQLLQYPLRCVQPQAAHGGQHLFQLLRRYAAAEPLQRQIQQGGIALPAAQQALHCGGGQRDILLSAPQDITAHGSGLPFLSAPYFT